MAVELPNTLIMNTTNKWHQAQITIALAAIGWISMTIIYALTTAPSSAFEVIRHVEAVETVHVTEVQNDALEVNASDVALWFADNDTILLTAWKDNDLNAVDSIMKDRQQFQRDIIYMELRKTLHYN